MNSELITLPDKTADAFTNMADDLLLLEHFPRPETIRWRHYGWSRHSFTFGYGQKYDFVKSRLAEFPAYQLCRRPTGGGIVDHRDEWTYSLVLPAGHPLYRDRSGQIYRLVHEALAEALRELGQTAGLEYSKVKVRGNGVISAAEAAECFSGPAEHDVVNPSTGRKIAGGALKRNRHGLLFQGSVDRTAAQAIGDWFALAATFTQVLGRRLEAEPKAEPWPEFQPGRAETISALFASDDWNRRR